jgi:hypothetical protein
MNALLVNVKAPVASDAPAPSLGPPSGGAPDEPDAAPEAEPDVDPEAVPDVAPDVEPDAVPDAEPEAEPDALPEAGPAAPDIEPEAEPEAEPGPEPELEPDALPVLPGVPELSEQAPARPIAPNVKSGRKANRIERYWKVFVTVDPKGAMADLERGVNALVAGNAAFLPCTLPSRRPSDVTLALTPLHALIGLRHQGGAALPPRHASLPPCPEPSHPD